MYSNQSLQQALPSTPLNELQLAQLSEAIQGLTREQVHWASGYLAGLIQHTGAEITADKSPARVTIVYATHTGNGRGIAEKLSADAAALGLNSRVLSASDFRPRDIRNEQLLLLVISTHGEGEVPESAAELERFLFNSRAPKLDSLSYSVFALGDSSYEFFCQAGKRFDERLQELGASRLLPRVDADVGFLQDADDWSARVLQQVQDALPQGASNVVSLPAVQARPRCRS